MIELIIRITVGAFFAVFWYALSRVSGNDIGIYAALGTIFAFLCLRGGEK